MDLGGGWQLGAYGRRQQTQTRLHELALRGGLPSGLDVDNGLRHLNAFDDGEFALRHGPCPLTQPITPAAPPRASPNGTFIACRSACFMKSGSSKGGLIMP